MKIKKNPSYKLHFESRYFEKFDTFTCGVCAVKIVLRDLNGFLLEKKIKYTYMMTMKNDTYYRFLLT